MFIPYHADVPMERWPYVNWVLIGITVLAYFVTMGSPALAMQMVLMDWSVTSLFGHLFVHGGIMHLIGNMIFLWVFGNAVAAKLGHFAFLPVYLGLGLFAGAAHLLIDGNPAVGASGAINGIVAMYLIWYPRNRVSCIFLAGVFTRRFQVPGVIMIVIWLLFDIWGAVSGAGGVAYFAHLGGFVGGASLALVLLRTDQVGIGRGEEALPQVLGLRFFLPARSESQAARSAGLRRAGPARSSRERLPEPAAEFPVPGGVGPRRAAAEAASASVANAPAGVVGEPTGRSPQPAAAPERDGRAQARRRRVQCSCGKVLRVPAEAAGKVIRCPNCEKRMRLGRAPAKG